MSNITAKLGPLGTTLSVKIAANGSVSPTNPVILGPTAYNNVVLDITAELANVASYAANVAAQAYANAVSTVETYEANVALHEDGGLF